MKNQVKYSLLQVKIKIAEKEAHIAQLKKDVEELKQLLSSQTILEKYGFLDNDSETEVTIIDALNTIKKNSGGAQIRNDANILKDIVKVSDGIETRDILEQYAERLNVEINAVRQFVDSTLSRFVKDGVFTREKVAFGRGSIYKAKNPASQG